MERKSELNVTVNTVNSTARLRTLTADLQRAEKQGISLVTALNQIGKAGGGTQLSSTLTRVNTGLKTNTQFLNQATAAADANTRATLATKTSQEKLAAAMAQSAAATTRASSAVTSATTTARIGQERLATATSQAAAAATRAGAATVAAANSARIGQERLSTATSQAAAAATRAGSATAAAANSARIGQERLTAAAAAAAAANSRAAAAATTAANSARIGQERLAAATAQTTAANARATTATINSTAATSRAAAAASRAAAASTSTANSARIGQERLAAATSAAAAAASRAAAANTNSTGATSRAAAAASRAAAAAAGLAAANDRAAAAALRLAVAEARAAADLARLGNAGARANTQMGGLMGTLNSMQGFLQGGLLAITGFSFLKTADEMQALNSQIKLVTASHEEYLGVREHIRRVADKNFNDVASTTNLYQKSARALADLGKSQSQAIEFTDAVSLAMRTGGRSALEQASAIYQLSQSMGAGVLNGDEFRTITETAPLLLSLVAKRMGVLQGDLKELSSEGKITSAIIYDAMVDNAELLEQMAAKMPVTMGQSLMVFKNQYKTFTDEIMNKQGGLSSIIAGSLMNMADNFGNIAKVAVAGLGLTFLQVAAMINVSTLAMKAFNLVVKANPLVLLVSTVLAVATAFYGVEDVLGTTGIMFGDLFRTVKLGLTSLSDLAWAVSYNFSAAMADGTDKSTQSFVGFFDYTETGFAGFLQGVARTTAAAGSTLAAFFQSIGAGAVNLVKSVSNIFISISNTVGSVMSGVTNEIISNVNGAIGFIDTLASRANSALNFFNSPLNFKMIGKIEYESKSTPTPLIPITKQTFGQRVENNLSVLMPQIDNYFGKLADRQAAAIAPTTPYALNTDPMSQEKLEQYLAREEQKRAAQAKLDAQIAANEQRRLANEAKRDAREGGLGVGAVAELVRKAVLGGKDWGVSRGGEFGGARGHNGLDIPTPVGTQVYAPEGGTVSTYGSNASRGGKQLVLIGESGKKYGFAHLDSFDVANGTQVPAGMGIAKSGNTGTRPDGRGYAAHLHLTVTDQNGKKINPKNATVNKSKYDATIGKYNASVENDAERERERLLKAQLQLVKEYGTQEQKLAVEHRERIDAISEGGLDTTEQARLIKISEERRARDLAQYRSNLDKKVAALGAYMQTERDMLEASRKEAQEALTFDEELSRPENAALLAQARELVDSKYRYDLQAYEDMLASQTSELYSFKATERQIYNNGWNDRIAEAKRATDELKDIRIEALTEEKAIADKIFENSHAQKLLDLNQIHMSEIAYIQARYALDAELNQLSNASPDVKSATAENLRVSSAQAARESQKRVTGAYGGQTAELLGQTTQYSSAKEKWEGDHVIAAEAFEEGVIGLEEYYERMLLLDEDYINKKQAILIGGYQTAFSVMGSLMRGFGLENSKAYKVLYAIEKGYALSKAWLNSKTAIMDAYSNASGGVWAKSAAAAKAAVETGLMTAGIEALNFKGFETGGYTGNGGTKDIAGFVHGKEYVFDAPATERIGVKNLEKIRSGEPISTAAPQVNITVVIDAKNNTSVTGSDDKMGRQMADAIRAVVLDVLRKEKRQGGML